jgi:hypothetical protein
MLFFETGLIVKILEIGEMGSQVMLDNCNKPGRSSLLRMCFGDY